MKRRIVRTGLTRRDMLKLGLVAGGSAMLPLETVEAKEEDKEEDKDEDAKRREESDNGTSASSASAALCSDFTQELFVPKIAQARVPGATDALDPVP